MQAFLSHLAWLEQRKPSLIEQVLRLADINSGSGNLSGLAAMAAALRPSLEALGAQVELRDLPPRIVVDDQGQTLSMPLGQTLVARCRPNHVRRVLLSIHMDTVFGPDHPFQQCRWADDQTLIGPGVADAKGGIVVLLAALETLERSPHAHGLGWTVILNSDEEVGSPGSVGLLKEEALRHDVGLVFEPALTPNGELAGSRGGSGNFVLVVQGQPAHVGRAFAEGRSAIVAMAQAVTALDQLNRDEPDIIVNVGQVHGGTALNVVPDRAVARVNVRIVHRADQARVQAHLNRISAELNARPGITAQWHGQFHCPPKPLDEPTRQLFEHLRQCGEALNLPVVWRATGGVSDGNKLAAAGLPTIDSLGPRGGGLHTGDEFILTDSLVERAGLTALLLMALAANALPWPRKASAPETLPCPD